MIYDPRADVAAAGAMENALAKLAPRDTSLVDATKVAAYLDEVRKHFPAGFEEQLWYAGVQDVVNNHVFHCFMTDGNPKECADKILEKVGADNA